MIKTAKELELKVKDARLLTKAELEEYGETGCGIDTIIYTMINVECDE
jgi:hypothetical protein